MRLSLLGPVFWYEAVATSRRSRYVLLRVLYAAVLLFVMFMQYSVLQLRNQLFSESSRANFAADFFAAFAFVQMAAVMALTPAMVAGTIAQERDRRTIEYLFASQLSNAEIVLGKLGARIAQTSMLLLTGLPVLAFAMLMGGIAPESLLLVFLATVSSTIMLAGISIGVSTASPRARDALVRVYVVLLALFAAPLLLASVVFVLSNLVDAPIVQDVLGSPAYRWITEINPLVLAGAIVAGDQAPTGESAFSRIWPIMAAQVGIGAAATLLAVLLVRRAHLRQSGQSSRRARRRRPRPRLDKSRFAHRPMAWKEIHHELGTRLGVLGRLAVWLLFGGAAATLALTAVWAAREMPLVRAAGTFAMSALAMGTVIACLGLLAVLVRAATSITREKERDCWVTLMSTPLTAREIVGGKIWGALYAGRKLGLAAAGTFALPMFAAPSFMFPFAMTCAIVVSLAFFTAVAGVFISTKLKSSVFATVIALALALAFASGAFTCCCCGAPLALFEFNTLGRDSSSLAQFLYAPSVPFLIGAPGALWLDPQGGAKEILAPFLIGLAGYTVVGVVLHRTLIGAFDVWSERKPVERRWKKGPKLRI